MVTFTKDELYWIERTADIESSYALANFCKLVSTDTTKLSEEEKEQLKRYGSELIDLHIFLKELRTKLEYERNQP